MDSDWNNSMLKTATIVAKIMAGCDMVDKINKVALL